MKVVIGEGRYLTTWGGFKGDTVPSVTLKPVSGPAVDLPGGRVQRKFIEFYIPAEYITQNNLPMLVECKANGQIVQIFELEASTAQQVSGSGHSVNYDAGWPARPTNDTNTVVTWIGGTPSTPPPGVSGVDIWMVPSS